MGREKETTTILHKYSLSKITKTNLSWGRKLKRKYKLEKKTKQLQIEIKDKKQKEEEENPSSRSAYKIKRQIL